MSISKKQLREAQELAQKLEIELGELRSRLSGSQADNTALRLQSVRMTALLDAFEHELKNQAAKYRPWPTSWQWRVWAWLTGVKL